MSKTEWSQDLNQSLIEKVRCGKSPTPKDRYDKFSYVSHKSNEDAKIRIQKDILDSLKEKDGTPSLVYPQDYIFDIAHFRANGNLGELIDDMSNIVNPEEKFDMMKSENKILRERLHNALQREMKAIKTFQKLANENRLLLLRVKDYEDVKKEIPHDDTNYVKPHALMNGENKKQTRIMVNKSTSTSDLRENTQSKSTSTDNSPPEEFLSQETSNKPENNIKILDSKNVNLRRVCDDSMELFQTKSSANILEDVSGLKTLERQGRVRSLSLNIDAQSERPKCDLNITGKSASTESIDSQSGLSIVNFRKPGEKRIASFPGCLDVVDEETDQIKQINPTGTDRSSLSSEGNVSLTHSLSSDMETNSSPCQTPSLENASSERIPFLPLESLNNLHLHSRSLPAKLNRQQHAQLDQSPNGSDNQLTYENNSNKKSLSEVPQTKKRQTTERSKLRKDSYSTGCLRSPPLQRFKDSPKVKSRKDVGKKKIEKTSSSEESDKEERSSTPQGKRRGGLNANTDLAAGILEFQNILNSGHIPQPSHESDDEQDILQACEAVRNQRYSCRRGSAVVQIPASSLQMDLHVATEEPSGVRSNGKKLIVPFLSLEDKRVSRWSSILKTKKKLLLHKDRLRISENLKEYLSTKVRPSHISSETELSLYRDTHWTHLMKVTDETGNSRRLSDTDSQYCLTENEMKRRESVWELFHSEVVYLTAHLLALKECFLEPLREIQGKGFLISIDDRKIFSNLEDLCEVSAKFAKDLLHLFKNEQEHQFGSTASVVSAFTKFKWTVHPQYERYCLSYTSTLNYLETLKAMEDVQEFFKWCETDSRCSRLKLTDLLVAPFQHLTKYPLLLKNIRKRTSEGDRQHAPLSSTIKSVEVLIQELESNISVVRNYQKLKDLQKNLTWPSVSELDPKSYIPEFLKGVVSHQECEDILASPKRQLIYQGPLTLHENTKNDVFTFLFDDMLLLTKGTKKSNRHLRKISIGSLQYGGSIQESLNVASPALSRKASDYSYSVWKQPLPIDRFILHDLDEYQGNSIRNGFALVHISRFKQAIAIHTLQASSKAAKDTWMSKLKETQDKWKEAIKQEDLEGKNQDNRSRTNTCVDEKSDSESEQESGTTSDRNSSNEDEDVFDEDHMEIQAATDSDANNHSNAHTLSVKHSGSG